MTHDIDKTLARESDRHLEIREALVARRGTRMANLLFEGAHATWLAKGLLSSLPKDEPLQAFLMERQIRGLLSSNSGLLFDCLKQATLAAGGVVTEAAQAEWVAEIEIIVDRMVETEANIRSAVQGKL